MARCPICESPRIIVVISPQPRALCVACGTRWVQEGSYQREVKASPAGRILAAQAHADDAPEGEAARLLGVDG